MTTAFLYLKRKIHNKLNKRTEIFFISFQLNPRKVNLESTYNVKKLKKVKKKRNHNLVYPYNINFSIDWFALLSLLFSKDSVT